MAAGSEPPAMLLLLHRRWLWPERSSFSTSPTPRRLALAGLTIFALGLLLYAVGRDPALVWLHPAGWSWRLAGAWLPDAVRASGPSFAHVLAFSLLSAAVLPQRLWLPACAAWLLLDALLEFAQLPQAQRWAAQHGVQAWPGGQFDPADLLALALGALAAAELLARPTPTQRDRTS